MESDLRTPAARLRAGLANLSATPPSPGARPLPRAAAGRPRPLGALLGGPSGSDQLAPAFTDLAATAEESLYVEGAARLIGEHRFQDVSQLNELMAMLERRVALLGVLREALGRRDVLIRIGTENEAPAMRSLSLVAAGYGLPSRNLVTVSVIGPVRMDYAAAIGAVQDASRELSRFVEDLYG